MKKQKFEKKLSLRARKISNFIEQSAIVGGATMLCVTQPNTLSYIELGCNTIAITQAIRCGHTIGNGKNPDGTPCTY
jgi:hypothetical protein